MSDPPGPPPPISQTPAGWYPDPEKAGMQRYWNGTAWTEHRAPLQAEDKGAGALVVVGYVTAVLLPIVGFILGIVLMVRRQTGHGLAVFLISVAVGVAACAIAVNDAEEELSQGVREFREDTQAYEDCLKRTNYRTAQCDHLLD